MENSKHATQLLVKKYADQGDPNGWFEEFYARADGDISKVYWADLCPNPLLLEWIEGHTKPVELRAITIGCGLGDDAEALVQHGYHVTAFDISPSAIAMCQNRYPNSNVDYLITDLFDYPDEWREGFDLVYECNTIQILSGSVRTKAVGVIADLVAPGGKLIVSCRSRHARKQLDAFPLALDRNEIDGFQQSGLFEEHFVAYDDNQDPPVPHFFAVYNRPV